MPAAGLTRATEPLAAQTLYLVRHGQSTWNEAGLLQGQDPRPRLTALGESQAHAPARVLVRCGARMILTSDLPRARQSAEPIASALALVPRPTTSLREQTFGDFEGRPSWQLWNLRPQPDWSDPDCVPTVGRAPATFTVGSDGC